MQITLNYHAELPPVRSKNYADQPAKLLDRNCLELDILKIQSKGIKCNIFAVDVIQMSLLHEIIKSLGFDYVSALLDLIKRRIQKSLPSNCRLYIITPTIFCFFLRQGRPVDKVCSSLILSLRQPIGCKGILIPTQPSIGILTISNSDDKDWLRMVVCAADTARERMLGWALYQPKLDVAQQRAFVLLSSLSTAVRSNDQLRLVYQPRVTIPSLACSSVEALIRWNHPQFGAISPAEFIPLAEKTSLIQEISRWVLNTAAEQINRWKIQGLNFRVSVNVTASDFETSGFVDDLAALILNSTLDPSMIEFELTESILTKNKGAVARHLKRTVNLGVRLAIDDFGTGYSNWSYLSKLPISIVKIDQSLIRHLQKSEKNQRVVKALIKLAKGLDYRVVAEGVNNLAVLRILAQWGCSEVQGYLIAKPMEAESLVKWLNIKKPLIFHDLKL
ncbi:phytochrome-like protein cph2 [Pseudomonas antarctica]|uniref:Phytochrome-like protein cph2 n=1 Tax=Pseudomonas antarctica TaxID=219572 RepID=A0ABQ6ZNH8_9PSED|nr:EAL domain-containing protein [Pseudomonas antarctica]KAF2405933.1 phytochrome-like protein cph2 [Pseudomonas antarctica]